MKTLTYCPGCDETQFAPEDHQHQYINVFNNTVTAWYIDGVAFSDINDALHYLKVEIGFTGNEARDFLLSLKKRYN